MDTNPAVNSPQANPHQDAPPSPSPEKKERAECRVSFITEDGKPIETVVGPSGLFQFWRQGQSEAESFIQCGDTKIKPQFALKKFYDEKVVRFPSFPAEYGTTVQLLDEMNQFILRYTDLPKDWLDIVCLYVLMTWVYDRFSAVPYLRFLGEPGTGKTRLLQVCSAISYKGTAISGNVTGPALFRSIDLVRGTMAVDEGDFRNSGEWSEIIKVLNNGYIVGTPVIRCNKTSFDPECFHVFGPKIISTRYRFDDEATETRCLTLETKELKVSPHIAFQMPAIFEQEALAIRNKLLGWRFQNFHHVTAKEDGLRNLFARTGQIGASLAAVAPDEQWMKKLIAFLQRYDESRNEESPKGQVQRALQRMSSGTRTTARVMEIAESVNTERKELGLDPLTDKKVGGILRSLSLAPKKTRLGFVVALPPPVNVAVNV